MGTRLGEYNLFNEIFSNRERLIRFASTYVLDRQAAEDLVMDSFLYYLERRDSLKSDENIKAYILVVLKHKCIDYLRNLKASQNAMNKMQEDALWDLNMNIETLEAFDPYMVLEDEYRETIINAIRSLPDKTKRIFLLSREKGMKYNEIADNLGISEKVVEYHMSKAIKTLKLELKDLYILIPLILNIS